jgi:hypothetical protein
MDISKTLVTKALTKSSKDLQSRVPPRSIVVMALVDKNIPKQALMELHSILKKPYQDICNVCNGSGKIEQSSTCPKCKGSGQRLLRLL